MRTLVFGLLSLVLLSPASAGSVLFVLGDSSAFGETDGSHNPSNGDRGTVRQFTDPFGRTTGTRPNVLAGTSRRTGKSATATSAFGGDAPRPQLTSGR
jgi:hypothetical protein